MNLLDWRSWHFPWWVAAVYIVCCVVLYAAYFYLLKKRGGPWVKLLLVAALAGILSGCGTCHDGYNHHWILGVPVDSEYSPCHLGCCKEHNPKNCGCTKSCPCWDKHAAPQNGG
jgi:hypothetical protein